MSSVSVLAVLACRVSGEYSAAEFLVRDTSSLAVAERRVRSWCRANGERCVAVDPGLREVHVLERGHGPGRWWVGGGRIVRSALDLAIRAETFAPVKSEEGE